LKNFILTTSEWLAAGVLLLAGVSAFGNVPGGGTNGPNVGIVDNGSTVTMTNGIVSILCDKKGDINQINYTFNNNGSSQTLNLLSGGHNGGQLYWETAGWGGNAFTYSVVANTGNYAEIDMFSGSASNGMWDVHFSMLKGSPGFYVTPIWIHRSQDAAMGMGETRDNIYAGSIFNWMSVDTNRNRIMEVSGGSAIGVQGAPVEVSLWTNGIYAGQYEDKYKYSADLGLNHVWGWSSVGTGGKNVGLWNISASSEYYNGGPLKRELMEHIGTTVLNMLNGGHYGMGSDGSWAAGEVWTKVYGPYFIYCNNVTNTLTATNLAAQALYNDALAQGAAEQTAWPYSWFTNASYAAASNRGVINGRFVINDTGNPNASAAGLWVGAVQQPSTTDGVYDFQQWMKPYQFWVHSDTNGNFTIPNVIAGANYTLYAFGPGTPDTFMSQAQTGGSPPLIVDYPASQFGVAVTGGVTNNLGTVTWTPARVGATVFEIGYPDRTAAKFRHGDDWWVGDIGPSPTAPSPVWSKWLELPFDFPNGANYVVGQNRWSTDWNFVQPVVVSSTGAYNNSSSTVTFNLATAPTNGATASLYLGLSSDYYSAIIVTVNGNNLGNVGGVTGTPNNSIPSTGYYAGYGGSDTTIREGNQAAASDERLNFPASQLHAGVNTINIGIRQIGGSYFADHAMYDYLRLEMTGYVPPPPGSVTAYAGNACNLVCWPVTPGATSYNILRSTSSGGGYVSITNGVVGPVCGSGSNNATYLDTSAANGTTCYYVVQSVNPTGSSANSSQSSGATPSAGNSVSAPSTPAGLVVGGTGHHSVTLNWSASANASYYSVWRSTLVNSGGGSSNVLSTIILNNSTTNATWTDTSPTDGGIYRYFVTATGPGGTSGASAPVVAVPLPSPPASLPASLTGNFTQTNAITLNWSPVSGAVGYAIYRATSANGPFTFLQSVTETTYTDYGVNTNTIYYYRVVAVNGAGVSANAADLVNSRQPAPASLSAIATNQQITLTWTESTNATSYTVKRGTSSGNETITVVTGYADTTYTNTGLANDTAYYYVVTATGTGGTSGNSPETSATPFGNTSGIWISTAGGNWGDATNWSGGAIASGTDSTADFSRISLPGDLTVNLDSDRAIGGLVFGDATAAYNWTLSGTNTLTLGNNPGIDVVNRSATISTAVAGSSGLTKTGPGALTFGGAVNTFTGGVTVNSGSMALDYSATNSPVADLIPSANAVSLGGGTLQINGSSDAASTQGFASATLNAGGSVISAAPASGVNYPVVSLGAVAANAGGVVEFVGPATIGYNGVNVASNTIITTTAGGNGAFVSGGANFATVGLYDFAATVGSAPPYTVIGGSQISGFYTSASGGSPGTSGNLDVTGNITGWSTQPYLASMRCNASLGASQTITLGNKGSTLTLPDILVTPNVGAYNVTFNSGNIRPGTGSSVPLVVWQNNVAGNLIFASSLGNASSGTSAYVQSGPGTVSITGTSSGYAGKSFLNGGVTLIAGNGSIGAAATGAAVNLNGGTLAANGTFALDNAGTGPRPVNLSGNGGGLAATAGHTLTVDGLVGSAANTGPLMIGIPASSANNNTVSLLPGTGSGTANVAVYATGTVVLTNANYYFGGTILQSGTLNFNGINALGGADFGGLTFNGGTLQYAASFSGNGSGDLTSIGTAGITLAAGGGTIDANGNAVTYAGSIGNGGRGGLTVESSEANGSLTLQGANTYQGNTTVTNATLWISNPGGSATGSGDVTVQTGGTLAGDGGVDGSVIVAAGGTFVPGDLTGSLNLATT
jgi:rhamnogalacturonan endolyase